jgi:hypothetical protein
MLFDPKKQITKPLRCPDCRADTDLLALQLNRRVFFSSVLQRHFFVCQNCGRLSYEIVLLPKEFHPRSDPGPVWFGMDLKGAASKEVSALQARQQHLTTLATERCAAPQRTGPQRR